MGKIDGVTAVVLAGGLSRRMGVDKAKIKFRGCTLLEHIVDLMNSIFEEVLVAGGEPLRFLNLPVPVVPDLLPGKAALIGIHAGLSAANNSRIFAIGCDAPFPNLDLVKYLVKINPDDDWVVPLTANGLEPLFSVYHKNCIKPLETIAEEGDMRIAHLAKKVAARYVSEEILRKYDPDLRSFININTPDDMKEMLDDSGN